MAEDKIVYLQRHGEYASNLADWQKQLVLYNGKREELINDTYLWKHEFEDWGTPEAQKLRNARERRTQYLNLIEPFVARFVSFVFSKGVIAGNMADIVDKEHLLNVNGKGHTFERFFRENMARNYFLHGKMIGSVDTPGDFMRSRADELAQGVRPYMLGWSPLNMPDWRRSQTGEFDWVRVEYESEIERGPTDPWVSKLCSKVYQLTQQGLLCTTFSSPQSSAIFGLNKNKPGSAFEATSVNMLGIDRVPFVVVESESWIQDGIGLALSIHNKRSVKDNIFNFQAHRQLIAIGAIQQDSDGKKVLANEGSIIIFQGEGQLYIVEPVNPEGLVRDIENDIAHLYKVLTLQTRQLASDSKAVESADTLGEQREDFRASMKSAAEDMQSAMREMLNLWADFTSNKTRSDLVVQNDFTDEDVDDFMKWATMFLSEIKSVPVWHKETLKKAAVKMRLPKEDEILKEIDTTDFNNGQETFRRASALSSRTRQEAQPRDSATSQSA